jgi:hypothetical protein
LLNNFAEKNFYDLVWSEPLKTLCSRFGISDVALKDAGKPTFQVALPCSRLERGMILRVASIPSSPPKKNRDYFGCIRVFSGIEQGIRMRNRDSNLKPYKPL